jgi:hypothetical protein
MPTRTAVRLGWRLGRTGAPPLVFARRGLDLTTNDVRPFLERKTLRARDVPELFLVLSSDRRAETLGQILNPSVVAAGVSRRRNRRLFRRLRDRRATRASPEPVGPSQRSKVQPFRSFFLLRVRLLVCNVHASSPFVCSMIALARGAPFPEGAPQFFGRDEFPT